MTSLRTIPHIIVIAPFSQCTQMTPMTVEPKNEIVVLLHGLARRASSMEKLKASLENAGYPVDNISYPSTEYPIETLSKQIRERIMLNYSDAVKIHFVTHSMGGIIVRQIQRTDPLPNIGRVVMLAPPNEGSEVVDRIGHWSIFRKIGGPAGQQLGTDNRGFLADLGAVNFDCGILTGDRSINWINSYIIPGPDDGKVSIEHAKVKGMIAFKTMHVTHVMIMRKARVHREVVNFLQKGSFFPEESD